MKSWRCLAMWVATVASLGAQQVSEPATPKAGEALPATDGQVWGALVYAATQAEHLTGAKGEAPAALKDLNVRLGKVFPYQHFEILGEHTQDVFREYESWVVPSEELFLKVDSKGPAEGGGVGLHLQFWRKDQVLVKTEAVLRLGSPLFISGPKWREGQLLLVLLLMDNAAE